MTAFQFQKMFDRSDQATQYYKLPGEYIETCVCEGKTILKVAENALTDLARKAFEDVAFLYRTSHLEQLRKITEDPEASENDRYVAMEMLKNAVIASEREFPMCQDTGTATIIAKKGQYVWTDGQDEASLSKGVYDAYTNNYLRYSQLIPLTMFDEENSKCNLPAQTDIYADDGDAYTFLFIAKGGGSANKTALYQESKALLRQDRLLTFLEEKIREIGTSGCPPYHLAIVIGGTSAEANLKTVKLASSGYLDTIADKGGGDAIAFRDRAMESAILAITQKNGIGAQFGGKYFCHDVRVIRLPRHGASCPVGIGVSCSADRNILGKITRDGVFLEQLDDNPARFLPKTLPTSSDGVKIDLSMPMATLLSTLSAYPVSTRLLLSGKIVVARDIAHAKLMERLEATGDLPDYMKNHVIYYAGPAKTPKGFPSGSFGPTTAGRMDSYVPTFQKHGGSMIMLAKGNRSDAVREACKQYGGFYLGSIGGPAARLGKECITDVRIIEYEELGMEAVHMITVRDFPAFILIDDKGNDFYQKTND